MTRRELNADAFGNLDEQVLVRDAIEEGTLDVNLLDIKVVDGGQAEDEEESG
jgi:hypothetical protein